MSQKILLSDVIDKLGQNLYQFNTATSGDPGTGKWLLNNADPTLATAAHISDSNLEGTDISDLISNLQIGETIYSVTSDASGTLPDLSTVHRYNVNDALTDNTTYYTVPIIYINHNGTSMSNDDRTMMVFGFNKASPPGGGGDVQVFTSSGTWTKPATGSIVRIIGSGGGGGGGSGAARLTGTGGSGGGSSPISRIDIPFSSLSATESITIGAGGTGGVGVTSSGGTNGNNGTDGSPSYMVGIWGTANGLKGLGGANGGTLSGGAAVESSYASYTVSGGANGGSATTGVGSSGAISAGLYSTGGAGGGGSNASVSSNGGTARPLDNTYPAAASSSLDKLDNAGGTCAGGTGGVADGGAGGNGNVHPTLLLGTGGGGGAADTNIATEIGGAGGNGGGYGAGGGGGGAASFNSGSGTSGAGGNGAKGFMIIITI